MQERPLHDADLEAALGQAGLRRDPAAIARLAQFVNLVAKWNRVHNLTGKGGNRTLVERHLVESLALQPLLEGMRIADVGSGAGFPGIPLAVCEAERRFTLIESRSKRVAFLRHAAATLRLANVEIAHSRAEDLPATPPFDTVLARAVARPAQLLEIVRPLLRCGGLLLVLTSVELAQTLREASPGFHGRTVESGGAPRIPSAIVALERSETQ